MPPLIAVLWLVPSLSLLPLNRSFRGWVVPQKRVVQRNCQTWIVESADQLVAEVAA
ncbi:hypothetical protein S7711_07145 [Stachybotrys chartarum IBT 7711]|uniref:Uncharacterized protein n=1 Tax=Stachybotrys chartarum (strain CBS 109288 / IBT 7711) TaxID=1280523 RepID=A0A084BAG0_STACB|nr:hypothetical protein S7711_07145 [Stachybotrys chartarum IBT 7711]